jgi:protein TonB
VGGQYVEPQVLDRPLPDYPALARQRGVHGTVRMEASIDEKGSVTSVRVLSGDVILAAAAKSTVMKWKYKPGTLNGRPIPTQMNVQVAFGERK